MEQSFWVGERVMHLSRCSSPGEGRVDAREGSMLTMRVSCVLVSWPPLCYGHARCTRPFSSTVVERSKRGQSDVRTRRSRCPWRSATRLLQRRRPAKAHIVSRVSNGRLNLAGNGWQTGDACRAWSCWELIPDEMGSRQGREPAVVHPSLRQRLARLRLESGWKRDAEGPHSSLRDPPVAGPRRRRRVVLGKAVHDSTPRKGRGMGGHQLKRNSAPPSIRHPPSQPCTFCVCVEPIRAPAGWLFRFRPVVAEAGRRPLSAVTFSSSPSAGWSVRSGSPWADGNCAGPNIHVYSIPSSFSSGRRKRRGTIHPLSLRIPKGLLQPAPPPDGGHSVLLHRAIARAAHGACATANTESEAACRASSAELLRATLPR